MQIEVRWQKDLSLALLVAFLFAFTMPLPTRAGVWWLPPFADFPDLWAPPKFRNWLVLACTTWVVIMQWARPCGGGAFVLRLVAPLAIIVMASWPKALMPFALLPFLVGTSAYVAWTTDQKNWVVSLLIAVTVSQCLAGLVLFWSEAQPFVSPAVGRRADGFYATPLAFYAFPVVGFCLGMHLFEERRKAWIGVSVVMLSLVVVTMTVTRGAVLGCLAAAIIMGIGSRRWIWVLPAIACTVFVFGMRSQSPEAHLNSVESSAARPRLWSVALSSIAEAPIDGKGSLSFFRSAAHGEEAKLGIPPGDYENLWLNIASDYGLFAMFGVSAILFMAVAGVRLREETWTAAAATAFLVCSVSDVQMFGGMGLLGASVLWSAVLGIAVKEGMLPRKRNEVSYPQTEPGRQGSHFCTGKD